MNRIAVLSWSNQLRTYSSINHAVYCRQHGYTYIYDTAPILEPINVYYGKVLKIRKFLRLFDWIFWIDDDAFFTNLDIPLTGFLEDPDAEPAHLLICKSPVNQGKFTYISSGQFFIRNTVESMEFLGAVRCLPREEILQNWNEAAYGIYTQGDQDAMTYLLNCDTRFKAPFAHIMEYTKFNCRPFHYDNSVNEHFIAHFTGQNKGALVKEFAERMHCNLALLNDNMVPDVYRNMVKTGS